MTPADTPKGAWSAHLVLADILQAQGELICEDPWVVPLMDPLAKPRLHVTQPARRIAVSPEGGRMLLVDWPQQRKETSGSGVLVTTSASPALDGQLSEAPYAVFFTDRAGPPSGFEPVHPDYPWLSIRRDVDPERAEQHVHRLHALSNGIEDALDAAQTRCRAGAAVEALSFDVDGGGVLWLHPMACLRFERSDDAVAALFQGEVRLDRFTPIQVRVPTLSIPKPCIAFDLDVNTAHPEDVLIDAASGIGLRRLPVQGRRQSLRVEEQRSANGYVDFVLRGHGRVLKAVGLRLEPPVLPADLPRLDPLARYDDPLAAHPGEQSV